MTESEARARRHVASSRCVAARGRDRRLPRRAVVGRDQHAPRQRHAAGAAAAGPSECSREIDGVALPVARSPSHAPLLRSRAREPGGRADDARREARHGRPARRRRLREHRHRRAEAVHSCPDAPGQPERHRLRRATGVTQLPSSLGLAATFNPSLARAYGAVLGAEARARGSPSSRDRTSISIGSRRADAPSRRTARTPTSPR